MKPPNSIIVATFLAWAIVSCCSCTSEQNGGEAAEQFVTNSKKTVKVDPEIEISGHLVRVSNGPYTSNGKPTADAEEFARKLILMLPEMKTFASNQLLETYNDSWTDADNPALTVPQFASNLKSPEIFVSDELGAANIYFSDSDMFGGHLVAVSVQEGKIDSASMK